MGPTSTSTSSARPTRAGLVLGVCGLLLLSGGLRVVTGQNGTAAKKVEVTEATCLMCHSDRPEMVEFAHRGHTADLGGCVVCHGPGEKHALSRGAPGTIVNPEKLTAPASDRSCLMCHSDFAAPKHFTPAPGKERCVDCHGIHGAPALPVAAAEPTPGRPALSLPVMAMDTEPQNRYYAPSLPFAEAGDLNLLGFDFTGEVRGGFRYSGTKGNDRMADQDLGYDTGFRLFDLTLDARSKADPKSGFHLETTGIDDPVEHYRLDARIGEEWSFKGRATRTNLVYRTANADPFDYSSRKEDLSLELSWSPDGPFRITGGLDLGQKEANRVGGRYFATGVAQTMEPIDEDGGYAFLRLDWNHGPFTLSVSQGYRWNQFDQGLRSPSPTAAGQRYLYHEQETDYRAPITTATAAWKPMDALKIDARIIWSPIRTDTDTDTYESGTLSGASFTEQVFGDVEADRSYLRGEVGATWFARPDLVVAARFEGLNDLEDLDGEFSTTTTSPAGQNASTTMTSSDVERDQRRWRFAVEANYQALEHASVRAGFEWSREEYDVEENKVSRTWDTSIYGPIVGFDIAVGEDLDIDVLYRYVRVTDPFTEIGTADSNQIKARVNWTPIDELTLSWYLTRRSRSNDRHDTNVLSWATGFRVSIDPVEDVHLEGGYDFERFKTTTDSMWFVNGALTSGDAEYDGSKHGLSFFSSWSATPEVRLTLAMAWWHTLIDFSSDYLDVKLGGEYDVTKKITVGTDLRYTSFNDDAFSFDDYDNYIAEIWMRYRF